MYFLFRKQHYYVIQMYQDLVELSEKVGFQEETNWYENIEYKFVKFT